MNVVDSSGWLAYFAEEPTAGFFARAIENTDQLLVPSICLYEVFKVILRERGENDAFIAAAAMQQGAVIDLDSSLAMEAASVGALEGLALADSIIYAVALRHSATLWTQDAHLSQKRGVKYVKKQTA